MFLLDQDEKERMQGALAGAIVEEKPNVKVWAMKLRMEHLMVQWPFFQDCMIPSGGNVKQ